MVGPEWGRGQAGAEVTPGPDPTGSCGRGLGSLQLAGARRPLWPPRPPRPLPIACKQRKSGNPHSCQQGRGRWARRCPTTAGGGAGPAALPNAQILSEQRDEVWPSPRHCSAVRRRHPRQFRQPPPRRRTSKGGVLDAGLSANRLALNFLSPGFPPSCSTTLEHPEPFCPGQ